MTRVALENMEFYAYHGYYDEEQIKGNITKAYLSILIAKENENTLNDNISTLEKSISIFASPVSSLLIKKVRSWGKEKLSPTVSYPASSTVIFRSLSMSKKDISDNI